MAVDLEFLEWAVPENKTEKHLGGKHNQSTHGQRGGAGGGGKKDPAVDADWEAAAARFSGPRPIRGSGPSRKIGDVTNEPLGKHRFSQGEKVKVTHGVPSGLRGAQGEIKGRTRHGWYDVELPAYNKTVRVGPNDLSPPHDKAGWTRGRKAGGGSLNLPKGTSINTKNLNRTYTGQKVRIYKSFTSSKGITTYGMKSMTKVLATSRGSTDALKKIAKMWQLETFDDF